MVGTALLISNRKDLMDFLNALAKESFYDELSRPDTKWKVVQISSITFYANSLKDAPLGSRVTFLDHIKDNRELVNVSEDNNLWIFRYLAVHRGGDGRWYERNVQKLFNNFWMHFEITYNAFAGVNLFDFVDLEDFFKINLVAYELEEGVAKLV